MVSQYFKQSLQMMRQNRLFSALYIGGTALTLTFCTVYAMTFFLKLAPVYPETHRANTAYISAAALRDTVQMSYQGWRLSYPIIRDEISKMKSIDLISVTQESQPITVADFSGMETEAVLKSVDPQFFLLYEFDFIKGVPFSAGDFESGLKQAVITDDLARKVFGADGIDGALGRNIQLNFLDYRVIGVVKGAPAIFKSFADIYIPYTSEESFEQQRTTSIPIGPYEALILTDDIDGARAELEQIKQRYDATDSTYVVLFNGQPFTHIQNELGKNNFSSGAKDGSTLLLGILPALLVLLIVPALNLSGMIAGRMEMRQAELGVRKSFGAIRRRLLSQVLWENLVLTVCGGVIGLVLVWILMSTVAGWFFNDILQMASYGSSVRLAPSMLFSPWIFVIVLVLCVLLNLVSALIPAWNSLRHPIVKSLKN